RMELVEGSAFRLPFRDGAFGAAVSAFVLRNLDDLPAAFAELFRVVAPAARWRWSTSPSHLTRWCAGSSTPTSASPPRPWVRWWEGATTTDTWCVRWPTFPTPRWCATSCGTPGSAGARLVP